MNSSTLTGIVGFIIGGAIGSLATYLYLHKDFENRIDAEVEALKARQNNILAADQSPKKPIETFKSAPKDRYPGDIYSIEDTEPVGETFRDESDLAEREFPQDDAPEEDDNDEEESDPDDFNERMGEEMTMAHSAMRKKRPYIIKSEDFGSESGYGEETLYYYTEDGALINDKEEEIEDYEFMLGNALTKFGFDHNDEHSIYVRNPNMEMDYEIIKVYSAFKDSAE